MMARENVQLILNYVNVNRMEYISSYYDWIKALHVIFVISWMAGMLYLPRLFVYSSKQTVGTETYNTLLVMQRKLIKIITVPAMLLTYIFGLLCSYIYGIEALGVWFHIKAMCIIGLTFLNGVFVIWHKQFVNGTNSHNTTFFKTINEIPTILMIIAVIMVIVKPFE